MSSFVRSLSLVFGLLVASQAFAGPGKDLNIANPQRIDYWNKKNQQQKNATPPVKLYKNTNKYKPQYDPLTHKLMQNARVRIIEQRKKSPNAKNASKTVKVLAVLVDFPDLPYNDNRLTSQDTDMFYSDYSVSHYQNMMFATDGYAGPSGQTLETVYQYYQQESGGEFFFTGQVFGWVTADNNADYYGANDPDNNDNDIRPEELVREAVEKAVLANNIDLTEYDVEDIYDLDGDGIINEPDGFIDHVNIFHSSIGEEAGGGVLGANAIWSHRFVVNQTGNPQTMGYEIANTGKRVFGYTIQPIDSAIGVVAHEFGHDLGLPDEYDTSGDNASVGAPTANWSIMASGSWTGSPSGSKPTSFSPTAREELELRHGVNFADQLVIDSNNLSEVESEYALVDAVTHGNGVNQLKINLPNAVLPLGQPYGGQYQYHSQAGDNLNTSLNYSIDIPAASSVTLRLRARYDIEEDWDYVQIKVNDTAVAGNHTRATNPWAQQYQQYQQAVNYITGKSADLADADANGWVELSFDLSNYQGQSVTLSAHYVTDTNTGGFGFVFDNLTLEADGSLVFSDDAETQGVATLQGFQRVESSYEGKPQYYYVQLRSHRLNDAGLQSRCYEPGILLWLADDNFSDNHVASHPGYGFVGVVDADQNMIGSLSTSSQVRDATFSLYDQSACQGDNNLTAISVFDDSNDYSSPAQPQSGKVVPMLGLRMVVKQQASDSSTATIGLSKQPLATQANFTFSVNERSVSFSDSSVSASGNLTYSWDFGDGNTSSAASPTHTYASDGSFTVTLTVTDSAQAQSSISQTVTIDTAPGASFSFTVNGATVNFNGVGSGGMGGLSYAWDFGDGNSSSEQSPNHSYTSDGSYSVTLTVTDGEGRDATATRTVTINTTPPVTEPPVSSSGGGGGSLGIGVLLLSLLTLRGRRS